MGNLSEDELSALLTNRVVVEDERVREALTNVRKSIESAGSRPDAKPVYRRRWAKVSLAGAIAGAASLIGLSTLTAGGGANLPLSVSSAAAAQLKRVAHAAGAAPGVSPGQWEYVEIKHLPVTNGSHVSQLWLRADGMGRERVVDHGVVVVDQVQGYPSSGINPNSPPSDPQALLSALAASDRLPGNDPRANPANAQALWDSLVIILLDSTSAQLRSTAFAALPYLPGTTVTGGQTDSLGRPGTAIAFPLPGGTIATLVASPSTGQILEQYDTLATASHGQPAGTVVGRDLFVDQAIVDSDTALPNGGSQPLTTTSPSNTTTTTSTSSPAGASTSTAPDITTTTVLPGATETDATVTTQ